MTISIGVAQVSAGDTLTMALIKAEQALYPAKHTGEDRFVLWTTRLATES